jgi:hypothetical protein
MHKHLEYWGVISGGSLPKPPAPSWSLQPEWKRCGNAGCHCSRGHLHGPYWYRRWREDGRQRKQYVPRDRVVDELALVDERRRARLSPWATRQMLAELRSIEKEIL